VPRDWRSPFLYEKPRNQSQPASGMFNRGPVNRMLINDMLRAPSFKNNTTAQTMSNMNISINTTFVHATARLRYLTDPLIPSRMR
jgi:hypothetical protein